MHGDLHPGNILLQTDEKGEKSLVYLDAGLVVELNGRDRKNFLNVFQHFVGFPKNQRAFIFLSKFYTSYGKYIK